MLGARTAAWAKSGGGWQPTPNAFVETDGVCYIDTGWVPTENGAYEIDARLNNVGLHGSMYPGGSLGARFYIHPYFDDIYFGQGRERHRFTGAGMCCTRFVASVDGVSLSARVNSIETSFVQSSWTLALTSFTLGGRHVGTTIDHKGPARVWKFRAWDNGTLVHDFYPREIDGVAGLWDMVTEQFVTGTGGSLVYGISES